MGRRSQLTKRCDRSYKKRTAMAKLQWHSELSSTGGLKKNSSGTKGDKLSSQWHVELAKPGDAKLMPEKTSRIQDQWHSLSTTSGGQVCWKTLSVAKHTIKTAKIIVPAMFRVAGLVKGKIPKGQSQWHLLPSVSRGQVCRLAQLATEHTTKTVVQNNFKDVVLVQVKSPKEHC